MTKQVYIIILNHKSRFQKVEKVEVIKEDDKMLNFAEFTKVGLYVFKGIIGNVIQFKHGWYVAVTDPQKINEAKRDILEFVIEKREERVSNLNKEIFEQKEHLFSLEKRLKGLYENE